MLVKHCEYKGEHPMFDVCSCRVEGFIGFKAFIGFIGFIELGGCIGFAGLRVLICCSFRVEGLKG